MKFHSKDDAVLFLIEINALDRISSVTENYKPVDEELGQFLKKRNEYITTLKNHRKGQAQKANWRANRTEMMKGIKAFHRSVEGKRFHRKLGRFMATQIFSPKRPNTRTYESIVENRETLLGLNSLKQHMFVEAEYFHQIQEQMELEDIITGHAIPVFTSIENKIISGETIDEDETAFLFDFVGENHIKDELATISGKTFDEISALWTQVENELASKGFAKSSESFYTYFVEELKQLLGK